MLSALLSSIIPTFGIIFIGWLCRRANIWKKSSVDVLNNYAFYIALPALIFYSLFNANIINTFAIDDIKMLAGTLAAHIIVIILVLPFLFCKKISKNTRATLPMLVTFGSTAYLGIPYATFAFGNTGTIYASMLSVALVVVLLFTSILILNQFVRVSIKKELIYTMLELPFLWAVIVGISLPIIGVTVLPSFINHTIQILSDSAGPTALLGLGAFLFDINLKQIPWKTTIIASALKVFLPTITTLTILHWLNVSGIRLIVAVAMASTSTAVTAFILSNQYKLGEKLTAGVILISTFFSCIALTAISIIWYSF